MDTNWFKDLFIDEAKAALIASSSSPSGGQADDDKWIDDGNTHFWISLGEGRTSPIFRIAVNGTATVDWGDGSTPDVFTGTSIYATLTKTHEYSNAGDYVITVSGEQIGVVGGSGGGGPLIFSTSGDNRNDAYKTAVKKVEIGKNVAYFGDYAFYYCYALTSVKIVERTNIPREAFYGCRALKRVILPDTFKSFGEGAFSGCYSLTSINFPSGLTSIGRNAFYQCYSLGTIDIPDTVTGIGDQAFNSCSGITSLIIPDTVTSIGKSAFSRCSGITNLKLPDKLYTLYNNAFEYCNGLKNVSFPGTVKNVADYAFSYCYGCAYYDFSQHTSVPTLYGSNAFAGIPADCEIRVPAALVDEWKAATNWSTYADYIVGV